MSMTTVYDIAVLGGGPAACVTAKGLSELGYKVILLTKTNKNERIEGVSERTVQALRQLGFKHALKTLSRPTSRDAMWGGEQRAENKEYISHRCSFDEALLTTITHSSVELTIGNIGQCAYQSTDNNTGHWSIAFTPVSTTTESIRCRFLVEARGRSAPKPSSGSIRGPATLSISQAYQFPNLHPHSAVRSFDAGWAWLAVNHLGRGRLQLMVDAKLGAGITNLSSRYDTFLHGCDWAKQWLTHAKPIGRPQACGAGMQLSQQLVTPTMLRVGDAAMAPDPLSGQGVYEAIGGALSAIPTINTLLNHPERIDLAINFYSERCIDRFYAIKKVAEEFYRQEQRYPKSEFWNKRVGIEEQADLLDDLASKSFVTEKAVVENNVIERRSVIVSKQYPRGVFCIAGIPVVELLDQLKNKKRVADSYLAEQFKQPKDHVIMARSFLAYQGLAQEVLW